MKTEREFIFTIVLKNEEFDLFKHIWVEVANVSRLKLDSTNKKEAEMLKKHQEFYEKLLAKLI